MKETMLTIDPGLSGTGWAIFHGKELIDHGTLHVGTKGDWIERAFQIARSLEYVAEYSKGIDLVVIEKCRNLPSAKGVAATLSDAIVKLAIFTGMCVMVCGQHAAHIELIEPSAWKGSMSKDVMDRRVARALGADDRQCKKPVKFIDSKLGKTSSHTRDAIGIGLSWLEIL